MQRTPITPEGHKKLIDELRHLKSVERPQNIRDIEVARAHGDLRENAEYHAAKEKQGWLDARIREVELRISTAEVIDPKNITERDRIVFGATVTLIETESQEEMTYQIVGDDESDVKSGRIGISSPIARGLIGKRSGEGVSIRTPKGEREFEVMFVVYK